MSIPEAPLAPALLPDRPRLQLTTMETDPTVLAEWSSLNSPTERLVQTFRGALLSGTLLDGRVWIGEYHLVFKFNWPKCSVVMVDWSDVIDIRRAAFAALIQNAIEVETLKETYFIGSLSKRDARLDLMKMVWDQIVEPASLLRKYPVLDMVCVCSDDTCGVCLKREAIRKEMEPKSWLEGLVAKGADDDEPIRSTSPSTLLNSLDSTQKESTDTDANSHKNTGCQCKLADPLFIHTFSSNIDDLWDDLFNFHPVSSIFTRFLINKQGTSNLSLTRWSLNGDDQAFEASSDCVGKGYQVPFSDIIENMQRHSESTVPLNHSIPFLAKSSKSIDTYKVICKDEHIVCVSHDTKVVEIGVETVLTIHVVEEGEECRLSGHLAVDVKGGGSIPVPTDMAKREATQGVLDFYKGYHSAYLKGLDKGCGCEDGFNLVGGERLDLSTDSIWSRVCDEVVQVMDLFGVKDLETTSWTMDGRRDFQKMGKNAGITLEEVKTGVVRFVKGRSPGSQVVATMVVRRKFENDFCLEVKTCWLDYDLEYKIRICVKFKEGLNRSNVQIFSQSNLLSSKERPQMWSDPDNTVQKLYLPLLTSLKISRKVEKPQDKFGLIAMIGIAFINALVMLLLMSKMTGYQSEMRDMMQKVDRLSM